MATDHSADVDKIVEAFTEKPAEVDTDGHVIDTESLTIKVEGTLKELGVEEPTEAQVAAFSNIYLAMSDYDTGFSDIGGIIPGQDIGDMLSDRGVEVAEEVLNLIQSVSSGEVSYEPPCIDEFIEYEGGDRAVWDPNEGTTTESEFKDRNPDVDVDKLKACKAPTVWMGT